MSLLNTGRLTVCILFLALICSCSDRSKYKDNMILPDSLFSKHPDFSRIDVFTADTSLYIEDIALETLLIPLDSPSEAMFRYADDLIINDSLILINSRSSIFFWNRDGSFKHRFNRFGRGPGEYIIIFGFAVAPDFSTMAITDQFTIKSYTLSGKFLKEIILPPSDPFRLTPELQFLNSNILLAENSRYKPAYDSGYSPAWKFDLLADTSAPVFTDYPDKVIKFKRKYLFHGKMTRTRNALLYAPAESSHIYRISESGDLQLYYDLDFGKYQMPEGLIHDTEHYFDYRKLFVRVTDIRESRRYLFVRYGINTGINGRNFEMGYVVFDKKADKVIANQFRADGLLSREYPDLRFWPAYSDGKTVLAGITYGESFQNTPFLKDNNIEKEDPVIVYLELK